MAEDEEILEGVRAGDIVVVLDALQAIYFSYHLAADLQDLALAIEVQRAKPCVNLECVEVPQVSSDVDLVQFVAVGEEQFESLVG